MKRFLALGAGGLALIVLVAACGGSTGSSTDTTASGTDASGSSAPYPELRWASSPISRADTVTDFNFGTTSLVGPVEQTLMSYTAEGKVVPGLAESMKNPNPTTYIYKLKSGVKFSDGHPVTGEDVLYSLKRNLSKESQTAASFADVANISLKNQDEIVFTLKEPNVTFPNLPAYAGQVLEKAAAEAGGESKLGTSANLPVGSGPYKFASFNPQQGATLVPNPYWTGEKLTAERVTVTWVKNDSALSLALGSGELDGDFFATSRVAFEHTPGIQIQTSPSPVQIALSMNTLVAPFNDVHVRRAIADVTDREGINQALYKGRAVIGDTLTPLMLYANIASSSEVEKAFESLPTYEYNLEAAKAEMAKSKYPNGANITFQSEPGTIKIGQILQPELAKIGIHLKVEEMSEPKFLEILFGPRDQLSLAVAPYGAQYPDPSSLMNFYISPEQAVVNGLNSANFKNPQVAKLLKEQLQEANPAKRLELITQIFQITGEEVPYVPLLNPELFLPISDKFAMSDFSQWTIGFGAWPLLISKVS